MPKTNNTRKQRAHELLRRLETGPALHFIPGLDEPINEAEVMRRYRLWARTWIIPTVVDLIPELCQASKQQYVIQHRRNEHAYWSEESAWGDLANATRYSGLEYVNVHLPFQGKWINLADARE